jgi:hypothetical protein
MNQHTMYDALETSETQTTKTDVGDTKLYGTSDL